MTTSDTERPVSDTPSANVGRPSRSSLLTLVRPAHRPGMPLFDARYFARLCGTPPMDEHTEGLILLRAVRFEILAAAVANVDGSSRTKARSLTAAERLGLARAARAAGGLPTPRRLSPIFWGLNLDDLDDKTIATYGAPTPIPGAFRLLSERSGDRMESRVGSTARKGRRAR